MLFVRRGLQKVAGSAEIKGLQAALVNQSALQAALVNKKVLCKQI